MLQPIVFTFNEKNKLIGFNDSYQFLVINNKVVEQVHSFTYLGCDLSYIQLNNAEVKLDKFKRHIYILRRTLIGQVHRTQ